jgi:hypothetical protein
MSRSVTEENSVTDAVSKTAETGEEGGREGSDDQAQSLGGSGVLGGRVEPPVRVLGGRVEPPVVKRADPAFDREETQTKVRVYI